MAQVHIGVNDKILQNGKQQVQLSDVAIWNEYGTRTAPPRPAFRQGTENAMKAQEKNIQAYMNNVFAHSMQKNSNPAVFDKLLYNLLKRLGQSAKKEVKKIIQGGSTAPNAPATIKKKGFDHPLYHHGDLLESVDYEIER